MIEVITIINQHTFNYGDDVAGVALLKQLRHWFPTAKINITYNRRLNDLTKIPYSDEGTEHFPSLILSEWNFLQAILYLLSKTLPITWKCRDTNIGKFRRLILDSDVIIVSPCGANIGIYTSWLFLFRTLLVVLERKPLYFHLNTVGKSRSLIFDVFARFVLQRSHVFVRENRSFISLKKWNISSFVGVDTAFSLPETELNIRSTFEGKSIVFIPTQLGNWHPHFSNKSDDLLLTQILPSLGNISRKLNAEVKILPHLYGRLDEADYLQVLLDRLLKSGVKASISNKVCSFIDYERDIASSYLTISMRYHGVVLAAKNAIPFISLSYENKMDEVCLYTGMENYNLPLHTITESELSDATMNIKNNYESIVNALAKRREYLRQMSSHVIPELYLQSLFWSS